MEEWAVVAKSSFGDGVGHLPARSETREQLPSRDPGERVAKVLGYCRHQSVIRDLRDSANSALTGLSGATSTNANCKSRLHAPVRLL